MKKLNVFIILLFTQIYCFGQGENNNYKIDSEDIKTVFEKQGIHIFKYPFNLKKGEYISISYEIYEKGKLTKTNNIIEDFQIDNDIKINHHIIPKDTTVFYRFYFFEKNDTLEMNENLPGIKSKQEIDVSKVAIGNFNSRTDIPQNLTKKHELLFYYGLFKNGEKIKQSNGWLNCSTGLPKDKLINDYDFVIIFYAERITKERVKTILDEIKNNR